MGCSDCGFCCVISENINFLKEKLITSIDADKTFDKIQHKHIIKNFSRLGIDGNFHTQIRISTKQSYRK